MKKQLEGEAHEYIDLIEGKVKFPYPNGYRVGSHSIQFDTILDL